VDRRRIGVVHSEGMGQRDWETRLCRGAPFAVVAVDPALRVIAWSGAARQMFGVGADGAVGREIAEIVGGDAAWWQRLFDEGSARLKVDTRVVEWTAVHEAGEPEVLCYGQDVTDHTVRESLSQLEGTLLRAILDNLDIVVWAMEPDGVCTYHQGKGLAKIGASPGAFVGQNFREKYQSRGESPFDRVFAGELHFVEAESHGQWFQNWMIPMRGASGGVELLVALSLNVTEQRHSERALRERLAEIEAQQRTIRELSTPIIEVWDRVLTLPILGMVDATRAAEIMEGLLHAVTSKRARFAILDLTGVREIDTATAGHLLGLVRAIRLLGAEGVVTGIHPNIAQTIVELGVELPNLIVHATLRGALGYCIGRLGR